MNAILHAPAGAAPTLPFRSAGLHEVLYVEDDATLRSFFASLLQKAGYHVEVAEDGLAGWNALHLRRYDLLITDNQMPRLTGLELVKRLRSEGRSLPVVLASGTFDGDDAQGYDALRIAARLTKPFSPEELVNTVEAISHGANSLWRQGGEMVSMFAETFSHVRPIRGWGINE